MPCGEHFKHKDAYGAMGAKYKHYGINHFLFAKNWSKGFVGGPPCSTVKLSH